MACHAVGQPTADIGQQIRQGCFLLSVQRGVGVQIRGPYGSEAGYATPGSPRVSGTPPPLQWRHQPVPRDQLML
eukprot:746736-Hanusia_phi.AAC.1